MLLFPFLLTTGRRCFPQGKIGCFSAIRVPRGMKDVKIQDFGPRTMFSLPGIRGSMSFPFQMRASQPVIPYLFKLEDLASALLETQMGTRLLTSESGRFLGSFGMRISGGTCSISPEGKRSWRYNFLDDINGRGAKGDELFLGPVRSACISSSTFWGLFWYQKTGFRST
jgi:hypothetical protein